MRWPSLRGQLLGLSCLLLLGAAVNVAVAWLFCSGPSSRDAQREQSSSFSKGFPWPRGTPPGWPRAFHRTVEHDTGSDLVAILGFSEPPPPGSTGDYEATFRDCGFPFVALRWRRWSDGTTVVSTSASAWPVARPVSTWETAIVTEGGPLAFLSRRGIEALPLMPVWPGIAVNSLLYAGLIWLLCRGMLIFRARLRQRRSQCPACGYPRGASSVCTECGRALTPQTETPRTPEWRRRVRACGLMATTAIAVVYVASIWLGISYKIENGCCLGVHRGQFTVGTCPLPWAFPGWTAPPRHYPFRADFHTSTDGFVTITHIPLWAPLLLVLIPTLFLFRFAQPSPAAPPTAS